MYCWEEIKEEVGGVNRMQSKSLPGSHGVTWQGGYTSIPTLTCDETTCDET